MKKGEIEPMQIVILFIILAVVAGVVIYIFVNYTGKEAGIIGSKIEGLNKDTDNDGVVDTADPCPCDPTPAPNCSPSISCLT